MDFFSTLSGAITTDIIIIAIVFISLFLFGVRYGKSSSTSLLLSLYVGILTFLSFPYLEEATFLKSSEVQITISHIALFFVLVFMIHSVIRRFIFTEYSGKRVLKYGETVILSGVSTALLFAFAYHTIPLTTLYNFGDSIDGLFSSQYFFWWLVAPMAGLLLVSRG